MSIILAIESSCDETSAAVCINGTIASNIVATQQVHEQYGGVVPELASRAHLQHIVPVVDAAILKANITLEALDAIAVTASPGLLGSLIVGTSFAKSMSLALGKPIIAVNHMHAHVLANLIPENKPDFPFLCLTVSGGHTQIVLCKSPNELTLLGETLDDAAGEAFDKSAKLLGLPYPGGPLIDKYAALGNEKAFTFPEPNIPDFNFSFSGLKTSILYFVQKQVAANPNFIQDNLPDICASIQNRIITILLKKLKKAAQHTGIKHICIAGGVSANKGLRTAFENLGKRMQWQTYIPAFEYCTDNAGMIAITGYYKYLANDFANIDFEPKARATW
jgi:N6-L-threonylcarbamoyladenine synthase